MTAPPLASSRLLDRSAFLAFLAIVTPVALVYGQTWGFDFVLWDDPRHVTSNPQVFGGLTGPSIAWAFETRYFGLWHPLTWLSHMADMEIWGTHAGGHHITSVVLHALSACVLFLFLRGATACFWRPLAVSLLFAVHPLHVESVAWVSERKDVLCGLFFLLALLFHGRWVRTGRRVFVIASYAAAILAGLAKPMAVSLPVVMALVDLWPLKRFDFAAAPWQALYRALKEKWPLLLAAAALSAFMMTEGRDHGLRAHSPGEALAIGERLQVFGLAYGTYLWKLIWPFDSSFYYPLHLPYSPPATLAGPLLIALLMVWAASDRRSRTVVFVGLGWYAVTLLPVSGIIQIADYAYADRYTYLPYIGLFIALAWAIPDVPHARRLAIALPCLAILGALTVLAHRQTGYWRDSVTLFSRAVALDENNLMAHSILGFAYLQQQRIELAEKHFREVVARRAGPQLAGQAHVYLGDIALKRGDRSAAQTSFEQAAQVDPGFFRARLRLGTMAVEDGRIAEGLAHLIAADHLKADAYEVVNGLGIALVRSGQIDQAIAQFERAVRINPYLPAARVNLARVLESTGRTSAAIAQYREVLARDPGDRAARDALARLQ